ncbi:tRNA (adenosine(37)-N6)-threonylcarbamoyltransferase complex ATPase subunit type 1 TsaE [Campylobacter sp. MIT 21-1685]|uniref:tRNA (adenosine(37)-N6)-threonylcarbamoyltransferase complex ATPase subunit type 1 TsaE n=1 Tax=unclassified Campylobacter TaxID=2593542 RepID=UPI00224AC031|nr:MULTISPECIES: tRNA (adenosine(37)-N6)-threonylcarbamoyltransferase complex ATPase subunit type 1 TsaE [unclassified Campylobacter]MCX2683125.1 tRNA (adenosine(37)-N6)-threonylcarbamoyltransferase complex ATPase subunit type 1 TsaE [Campylobacter sp. MIT 21-1684]MCX2751415.1 tRNA (adenosine(37)-N6)-threonylcarbamoyltransferase complex ATPase subunit type 1 TsaE [Campylobacter sp. MIT 21-1682]MCX2807615.1 tRNA (adenosine(37)-N6)-threonylcarbamoyltransferase complex ATPase subunit type 1 TsaE [C
MKEFILFQDELQVLFFHLPQDGVVLLRGEVASGKTTLVQKWVNFLGIQAEVHSPTFSLMQKYHKETLCVYHYDLYQVGLQGILANGLFEIFFEKALHCVEWGDEEVEKALGRLGITSTIVEIIALEQKRKYTIYE